MNSPLRVLVVEDSAVERQAMCCLLEEMDPARAIVTEGVDTLSACMKRLASPPSPCAGCPPIDAVLLDLLLPDADNMEAMQRIRRAYPYMPVVVVSGIGPERETEALHAGACDFFSKPVNGELVVKALRRSHIRRQVWREMEPIHEKVENAGTAVQEAKGALLLVKEPPPLAVAVESKP